MQQEELQKLLDDFEKSEIAQVSQWKIDKKDNAISLLNEYRRPDLGGKKQLGNCNLNKWKEENRDEFIKASSHGNKSRKTNGHSEGKVVLVFKDGVFINEYPSISECCRILQLDKKSTWSVLEGRYKQHKGYTFKYKD